MKITDIQMVGQIADLKDTNYKNTLSITALIEILIQKGLFSREEFNKQTQALEQVTLAEIIAQRRLQRLEHSTKNKKVEG